MPRASDTKQFNYRTQNLPVSGQRVRAINVLGPLEDLRQDLNNPTSILKGGTGATRAEDARTALGLAIGSDVEAHSDVLTAFAGKTWSAGNIPYFTGSSAVASLTFRDEDDMSGNDALGVPSQQSVKAYVDGKDTATRSYAEAFWVPGLILPYGGSTAPAGWLLCNGASVSRTTYADLFNAIGTAFGSQSVTTFNLPDCRGRVLVGAGGTSDTLLGNAVGNTGGARSTTLAEGNLPAHTHGAGTLATSEGRSHSHSLPFANSIAGTGSTKNDLDDNESGFQGSTGSAGAHTHTITGDTGSAGSGQSFTNLPPSLVVSAIIRT